MTKLPDFDQTHILESLKDHLSLTKVDCPCSDCNYMFCPVTEELYSCCFKHREWLNKMRTLEKLIQVTENANLYFEGRREQNADN